MENHALAGLVASVTVAGWRFWVDFQPDHRWVHAAKTVSPEDNRHPGRQLDDYGDSFLVPPAWDETMVVRRLFATLQYLTDHELREQFTLNGVRVFEAHDPPVTGYQKDWFVEHQSAVRGY